MSYFIGARPGASCAAGTLNRAFCVDVTRGAREVNTAEVGARGIFLADLFDYN